MPYSSTEGKDWMRGQIDRLAPASVLDVGAGCGTYFDLAAQPGQAWAAVEAWEPYVAQFGLPAKYSGGVVIGDVRRLLWPDVSLVIFGDVLEHMPRADALAVWQSARERSRSVLLSIPIVPYPQGPEEGNPYEEHVETWTHAECLALPGVVAHQRNLTIGCYLAEGLR
jgi:hypothetical protein